MQPQQKSTRLPKINQFDSMFSQLSLSNVPEQKHNQTICKGMLNMMKKNQNSQCTKIKKQIFQEQQACPKNRCNNNLGSTLEIDLSVFKIRQCQMECQHNQKQCPFFHSEDDLIRPGGFYKTELCQYKTQKLECPYGYNCCHAHNQYEQLYQEGVYRKKFCPQPDNCCFGQYCAFAHSEKDIKCELIHLYQHDHDYYMFVYKTVNCPYILINHDQVLINLIRSICHYYHNETDQRRKQNIIEIQPQLCQNIQLKKQCTQNCQFCHNNFEFYYHPMFYKTFQCQQEFCYNDNCPAYHNEQDIRILSPLVTSGIMKIVPKNRYEETSAKRSQIKFPNINS